MAHLFDLRLTCTLVVPVNGRLHRLTLKRTITPPVADVFMVRVADGLFPAAPAALGVETLVVGVPRLVVPAADAQAGERWATASDFEVHRPDFEGFSALDQVRAACEGWAVAEVKDVSDSPPPCAGGGDCAAPPPAQPPAAPPAGPRLFGPFPFPFPGPPAAAAGGPPAVAPGHTFNISGGEVRLYYEAAPAPAEAPAGGAS